MIYLNMMPLLCFLSTECDGKANRSVRWQAQRKRGTETNGAGREWFQTFWFHLSVKIHYTFEENWWLVLLSQKYQHCGWNACCCVYIVCLFVCLFWCLLIGYRSHAMAQPHTVCHITFRFCRFVCIHFIRKRYGRQRIATLLILRSLPYLPWCLASFVRRDIWQRFFGCTNSHIQFE